MVPRRSVKLPITLAVVMTVLLAVLTVGWVLLAVFGALSNPHFAGLNWTLFALGTSFIVLLLVGVAIYTILSIKAINLTRRQSNFIDSVTHELKSPIASMKLYLQTLHRRQVSHDQQTSFYELMLDDIERLDHLINQMLDAGRLESERSPDEEEDVGLDELLRHCTELTCLRFRIDPATVGLDLEPCRVRARRSDLEMVFRNLLDNALKYAASPPEVEVHLRLESERLAVVRVSDNGPGVPTSMRRKVFRRFVRLGSELEREKPGTGLGLYIAATIVRRLRGRIRVRDRRPPPGAVFEVHLPAAPAPGDNPEREVVPKAETV